MAGLGSSDPLNPAGLGGSIVNRSSSAQRRRASTTIASLMVRFETATLAHVHNLLPADGHPQTLG